MLGGKTMLEANLIKRIEDLERRVKELENIIKSEKIVVVREISHEEAKKLILDYIKDKKGKIITPLKISEDLQIPYEVAHAIVLELIKEGRLKPVEDYDEGD